MFSQLSGGRIRLNQIRGFRHLILGSGINWRRLLFFAKWVGEISVNVLFIEGAVEFFLYKIVLFSMGGINISFGSLVLALCNFRCIRGAKYYPFGCSIIVWGFGIAPSSEAAGWEALVLISRSFGGSPYPRMIGKFSRGVGLGRMLPSIA